MKTENRKCRECGKDFTVRIDGQGKIHSFDPYGVFCDSCSYKRAYNEYDPDTDQGYDIDFFEEARERDSGFLGSMLEAQLIRDGQEICPQCKKPIKSVLDQNTPNQCTNEKHNDFKRLFAVRLEIGRRDLATRGYD